MGSMLFMRVSGLRGEAIQRCHGAFRGIVGVRPSNYPLDSYRLRDSPAVGSNDLRLRRDIGTIFTGLALFLLSIGFLFRRVRLASSLAIIASILFFVPIIGDRAGAFFSLPIPPAINMLEYLLVVVLFATLYLASRVYRKSTAASKQPSASPS